MKNFEDFVDSIPEQTFIDLIDHAGERLKAANSDNQLGLGNQIGLISYQIALDLLHLYHNWNQNT